MRPSCCRQLAARVTNTSNFNRRLIMARKTESKSSKTRSRSSTGRSKSSSSGSGHAAQMTTDHDEIRRWAEERGGKPACVRGTENKDSCLLRIDFPGGAGEESLSEMEWEDFFRVLDDRDLVFLYQEEKADGEQSTFNKLISAEEATMQQNDQKRGRRAGASGSSGRSTGRTADRSSTPGKGNGGSSSSSRSGKKTSSARHGRGSR